MEPADPARFEIDTAFDRIALLLAAADHVVGAQPLPDFHQALAFAVGEIAAGRLERQIGAFPGHDEEVRRARRTVRGPCRTGAPA